MTSTENSNWMRLELAARSENVGLARVSVAAFAAEAGFTLTQVDEIKIIISEAVSNVVLHAYPGCSEGTVVIEARISGDMLRVRVRDEGVGMEDVERARRTSFSTLDGRMGMGFTFIASFSDRLDIESSPGEGTAVIVDVHRASSDRDPDPEDGQ